MFQWSCIRSGHESKAEDGMEMNNQDIELEKEEGDNLLTLIDHRYRDFEVTRFEEVFLLLLILIYSYR